jgi:hypothetical protein
VGSGRIRLVVGVVALVFALVITFGATGLFGSGPALGSSTTITVIGGAVTVRHGANGTFVAAVDGEVLRAGDAVHTDADARAVLTYFEGSTVTVEPNTDLSIDEAAPQGDSSFVAMTQTAGRTWHVVTRLVTGDSKYEVRTPASTASVRGTAFTVDTDGGTTTITTTDGTVLDRVPDPNNPGSFISVPVPAGQQHRQQRGTPPSQAENAPEPARVVTVTLGEESSIVIDTLGRANGIDANGRVVLQTPGATLERKDGHLVITLPNIPDGRLQALVRKSGADVDLETVVHERGKTDVTSTGKVNATNADGRANVDLTSTGAGSPKVEETQAPSPTPSASTSASATPSATSADGGSAGGSGSGSGGGQGQSGQGQGGGQGQGQGNNPGGGKPTQTPGFVPTFTPTIPTPQPTTSPSPTGNGNGNGGNGSQGGGQGHQGQGGGSNHPGGSRP